MVEHHGSFVWYELMTTDMAAAATFITRLLVRHSWIAWLGLAIILYVALEMIWRGAHELGFGSL